jgi:hypothetical protein
MIKIGASCVAVTLLAATAFLSATNAHAVTVSGNITVNDPPADTESTIFLDLNASTTTATGHVGSQTGDPGTPIITFTTDQNAKIANGVASIKSLDPEFKTLTITVPLGWFFTDLEFSTQKADQLTITAKNGASVIGTASATDLGNGDTKWLVEAVATYEFTSFVLTSADAFAEVKQVAISGLHFVCQIDCPPNNGPPPPVPLPAALPLFAGGLGALALLARRKKKKTSTG